MPFTISHIAAALPLRRMNLNWSAFVIGSIAPDFPYILGTDKYRLLGHTFPGVVLYTFPAALFALWLFHTAIKRPAVGLLPVGFHQRLRPHLGPFRFGGISRFAAIVFSLTLGIAIHIGWDAFTHPFTWPWRRWVWLRSWIYVPLRGPTEMDVVLQYASTVTGIVALALWVALWYRKTAPITEDVPLEGTRSHSILAFSMLVVAAVGGFVRALVLTGVLRNINGVDQFLFSFGITSMAVAFWELLVYSLLTTARQHQLS